MYDTNIVSLYDYYYLQNNTSLQYNTCINCYKMYTYLKVKTDLDSDAKKSAAEVEHEIKNFWIREILCHFIWL